MVGGATGQAEQSTSYGCPTDACHECISVLLPATEHARFSLVRLNMSIADQEPSNEKREVCLQPHHGLPGALPGNIFRYSDT